MAARQQRKAFAGLVKKYLDKLRELARDRDATSELSLRPALDLLLAGLSEVFNTQEMAIVTEPIRRSYGAPDYKLKTNRGFLIGYVEAKGLGSDISNLDNLPERDQEQIELYRESGKRFVLTNHLNFILYDYASDGKTVLPGAPVALLSESDFYKGRAPDPAEIEALYRLFDRFLREARPDIGTPKELAERLAASARYIRDELRHSYEEEGDHGDLHDLKAAFEKTLIPDLSVEQFTDMYAQTLTYGLFAARVNHQGPELLTLDNAWHDIPKTNPFLRRLFESVTGSALEDKPYRWIIEDLVHLLNALDMNAILEGFGKRTAQEDPIVHFYEDFLAEYDPKERERRGVYYTPEPVVLYIARSVDYLLKEKFGLAKGLADKGKVTYTVKRNSEEHQEESHKVLILDPACGTGTFLYFVIDLIRKRFMERGEAGMWRDYVREHLLPRIFGFELLMAPYAMSHLKLGMQLAGLDLPEEQRKDWAYEFETDERLGIYLTNTLEEPRPREIPLLDPFLRMISEEAKAAARVKKDLPILVVLGNPPYSANSANRELRWINDLVRSTYYPRDEIKEHNLKLLLDDYVKFIRWAQWRIDQTGSGILAFISNHGYLDNPTFRAMRKSLMESFTDIYLINLHGNVKKRERAPDGGPDENVFDIQQGVAIGIFVETDEAASAARAHYLDLWGTREFKYERLAELELKDASWQLLEPQAPFFLFVPQDTTLLPEYERGWKVNAIFPIQSTGIKTHRDHFVLDFDRDELERRIREFRDLSIDDRTIREKYKLPDTRDWKLSIRRASLAQNEEWQEFFSQCLYRPFDLRPIYYHADVIELPRPEVMRHMLAGENLGISMTRAVEIGRPFEHVFCTRWLIQHHTVSLKEVNYLLPLYLYPTEKDKQAGETRRRANLNPDFLAELSERLGLEFVPDGRGDLKGTFGPEDVFHYIYAVLHSPTYRKRYKEFLKIDFPRIPLTSNLELFRQLCQRGADLVALHLLERDYEAASWNLDKSKPNPFDNIKVRYPVPGEDVVEKGYPKYFAPGEKAPGSDEPLKEGRVYISAEKPKKGKKGQYFEGVPPEVWEFHVGGYQVCHKWLKDRRGRKLSYDDKEHYKKIVMALGETIRLMGEIDEIIEQYGGWPIE